MISSTTLKLLLDAGLSGETLTAVTAAFDADMENVCNMLRNNVTLSDAGSVTPAALRMRKMRTKRLFEKGEWRSVGCEPECNSVTSPSVTSDNILTLSKGIEKEESKPVVIARGRKKPDYSGIFEQFWLAFPTDKGMAKLEAWKAWQHLTSVDMFAAIDGIPGFKKWAAEQGPNYRMVHACRYISQRRFDGFPPESKIPLSDKDQGVRVNAGTDQWDEWESYLLRTTGKKPWRDLKGGRYFPSEFPPQEQAA